MRKSALLVSLLIASALILMMDIQMLAVTNSKAAATEERHHHCFWHRLMYEIQDMLGICHGNYTEISGIMEYDGKNFYVNDVELHFGPSWYIKIAESAYDYDEDGVNETVFEELEGLVGSNVTMGGYMRCEDWMCVTTINGVTYREPGKPIWASKHHMWHHGGNHHGNHSDHHGGDHGHDGHGGHDIL